MITTIQQLTEEKDRFTSGTTFKVKGYISSSGIPSDFTAVLCGSDDYRALVFSDSRTLSKSLEECEDAEYKATVTPMVASILKTLEEAPPNPEDIYAHVVVGEGKVNIRAALLTDGKINRAAPKSEAAIAKHEVRLALNLASNNYAFSLRFEDGKFESIEIL